MLSRIDTMFRIGEFSKLARVTTRQLRFYDENGLLHPVHIDNETGYRYYSATQLPRIHRILALKELGLTLEQIARLVDDNVSAEEMRGMLTMKKAQIEQLVREELVRIQGIEDRIRQIDDKGGLRDYEVTVKRVPEQRILSVRETVPTLYEGLALMHQINHLLPMRAGRDTLGHLTVIIHSDSWTVEDVDVEMGFLVEQPLVDAVRLANGRQLTLRSLPEVQMMASVVRVGLFTDPLGCHKALATWIETNDYQIAGLGREIFIEPFQADKENEAVVEVQMPVQKFD
jgi:DNA-binding transcriptional MerR regulator